MVENLKCDVEPVNCVSLREAKVYLFGRGLEIVQIPFPLTSKGNVVFPACLLQRFNCSVNRPDILAIVKSRDTVIPVPSRRQRVELGMSEPTQKPSLRRPKWRRT